MKLTPLFVNTFRFIFFAFFLLGLSGCFEVREEISIRPDGAGKYALILDMSQSQELINKKIDATEDTPLVGLDSAFIRSAKHLNEIQGISHAQGIKDVKNFRFGIEFRFVNTDALNRALSEMNHEEGNYPPEPLEIYDFTKKTLTRSENFYLKMVLETLDANHEQEAKNMLQRASYTHLMRTSSKFKKYSNKDYRLSSNKKELQLSGNINEILAGKIKTANEVKLKK